MIATGRQMPAFWDDRVIEKAARLAHTQRLGRYHIVEEFARGGMAQVFIAQKDGSPHVCILKRLLVEWEPHEVASKRFQREAKLASYLNHPNIAKITDAGVEDGTFCIAMEFVPGKDVEAMMHKLMASGLMLPHEVSIGIVLKVLDGLEYAHDARDPDGNALELVHRDLSPRNVLVSYSGDVKIIDFGVARGRLDDFKTAPGMILGTLRYSSPEQARTLPVDRRSDLYTLSVVLYEMLTGRPLVNPGRPQDVLQAVVRTSPPPLSVLNPNLPRALDAVLARGLAKDPDTRFATAGEMRRALTDAAGSLARAPKETIGALVTRLFPDEERRLADLFEGARRRFDENSRSGPPGSLDSGDSTTDEPAPGIASAASGLYAAGPDSLGGVRRRSADLPEPGDPEERTRTAVVGRGASGAGRMPVVADPTDDLTDEAEGLPRVDPTQVVRKKRGGSVARNDGLTEVGGAPGGRTQLTEVGGRTALTQIVGSEPPGPMTVATTTFPSPRPLAIPGLLGAAQDRLPSAPHGRPPTSKRLLIAIVPLALLALVGVGFVFGSRPPAGAGDSSSAAAKTAAPSAHAKPQLSVSGGKAPVEAVEEVAEPALVPLAPVEVSDAPDEAAPKRDRRPAQPAKAPAKAPGEPSTGASGANAKAPPPPPPPKPAEPAEPAAARPSADPYPALTDLFERAKRTGDSKLIGKLETDILQALETIPDGPEKKSVKRCVHSSSLVEDLSGLGGCLEKLKAAARK